MKAKFWLMAVSVITAAFLGACSVNIDGDRLDLDGSISYTEGTSLIEEENLAQSADGVKTLEIVNSAGNINITRSDSKDVSVKFTKKVKGTDETEKKEIMDSIYLKMDANGDKLAISARSSDESNSYIWDWVSRLYKSVSVTIDYDIKVPEGVKVYKIDNKAGNTVLDTVAGEIDIRQNAGDINLNGVSLEGESSFNLSAGNITMDAVVDGADEITINGTAGNIGIKMPAASRFDLEARVMAGKLSGSFLSGTSIKSGTFSQEFNGGGAKLLVTLAAGNVIIDAK